MNLIIIKPKAMAFFKDRAVSEAVVNAFCASGWNIDCENSLADISKLLDVSNSDPYSVFISGPELIKRHYEQLDKIFQKLSYTLHRIIIIVEAEKEDLITAVNIGNVQACLFFPFKKEQLVSHAKICFRHYRKEQKRQQLKRLTLRQARQLYEMAKNFKIKEENNKRLINKRQISLATLKAQMRQEDQKSGVPSNLSLEKFITQKNISLEPDNFLNQFLVVALQVKHLVEKMAIKHSAEWEASDLKSVIQNDGEVFDHPDLIGTVRNYALIKALTADSDIDVSELVTRHETIDDFIKLIISTDHATAYLERKKKFSSEIVNLESVLVYLDQHQIIYGIVEKDEIIRWLNNDHNDEGRILIAQGKRPAPSKDGSIEYFFKTDYTNPGRIQADGSIDFKDRGEVPYVEEGSLLARKTPPVEGFSGVDVFGNEILIKEPVDPSFAPGAGTRPSDDRLSVFADRNGQPYLDAMGTITVNQEFVIRGDVDYKTGNIDFDGNILVSGTIKEGFKVKGINLTANEIEGATIELTGELNVSNGITSAKIITVGNIHTKFINRSSILGFGDFSVLKEIIDSDIMLGGKCDVSAGHVIASSLSAKCGIKAGNIGTVSSSPADLRIGFDDHIRKIEKKVEEELKVSMDEVTRLKSKIEKLNVDDQQLYRDVSEQAFIRDMSLVEIDQCEKQLAEIETSGDALLFRKTTAAIKSLKKKVDRANNTENQIVKRLDTIGAEMELLKNKIHQSEEKNVSYMTEIKRLKECKKKRKSNPVVVVGKTIVQGTKIASPNSSLVLKEDQSRCTIREVKNEQDNVSFYQLQVVSNI
ncbi:MAG: FapA family protein [Desulfobacterales bacterium]|nr:FapA family protein [Desulfobacterales bacterium]